MLCSETHNIPRPCIVLALHIDCSHMYTSYFRHITLKCSYCWMFVRQFGLDIHLKDIMHNNSNMWKGSVNVNFEVLISN